MALRYQLPDPKNPKHKDRLLVLDISTKNSAALCATMCLINQHMDHLIKLHGEFFGKGRIYDRAMKLYAHFQKEFDSGVRLEKLGVVYHKIQFLIAVRDVEKKLIAISSDFHKIRLECADIYRTMPF